MAKRCDQCLTEGITLFPHRSGLKVINRKLDYNQLIIKRNTAYIMKQFRQIILHPPLA